MRSKLQDFSLLDKLLGLIENQRPSDRFILRFLFFAMIGSIIYLIINLNNHYSILVPTTGGNLVEGIIGTPRFINPILATTRADQDTAALIYSGLLRIDPNGNLENDLAEIINISEDGLIYNIKIKKNQYFHDNTPLTAKDVVFTLNLIKNPDLRSPFRGNWNDVNIEQINEYELSVTLKEPYTPFIENFTLGILPAHIWSNLSIEQLPFSKYNTEPVGSGIFKIENIERDESGLINGYLMKTAEDDNQTKLKEIKLKYFQNEELLTKAFENKEINASVFLSSDSIKKLENDNNFQIISEPIPRIFGVFFNQNKSPALRDRAVREALNLSIDRKRIIDEVLSGYGFPTQNAVLTAQNGLELGNTNSTDNSVSLISTAHDVLVKGGWKQNATGFWEKEIDKSNELLSITIKTSNSELFEKTANILAEEWRKLGVEVAIEQYEQSGLVEPVIRTREFQALLFGIDINRTGDMYPFWHSSQKDDPGLNISQYTNVNVDNLLEKTRTIKDETEKQKAVDEISNILNQEIPAVFLFAPNMTYVIDKNIKIVSMTKLDRPSDRFMNISKWHANTENLWPIFQDK